MRRRCSCHPNEKPPRFADEWSPEIGAGIGGVLLCLAAVLLFAAGENTLAIFALVPGAGLAAMWADSAL